MHKIKICVTTRWHIQKKISSMFHPDVSGISQSLVWHWHVGIGCSPDGKCPRLVGAAREGGDEMRLDWF